MATKLTKVFVDKVPNPDSGQIFYRDDELKGFGLRVGAKSKVYIAETKLNGKTVRMTIGKHGVFTPEEARLLAKSLLGKVAQGINPIEAEKERQAKNVSLAQVLEDFLQSRKNLKQSTIKDYRRVLNSYLVDWKNKPVIDISKDMVERMHRKIGQRSPAQANLVMRYLRALINYAMAQYEDAKGEPFITFNPVMRLTQTRAWYRVDRRQTIVKAYDLAKWYEAVMSLKNDTVAPNRDAIRDYLLLVLFTGLRRAEAAQLTWNRVDFQNRTIVIVDTKNHNDHVLPLTDYLYELLQNRKAYSRSQYVFPNESETGRLVEPRKQIQRVRQESGVEFTLHDLRRTFITIAESLDIPAYALKRLLNHKMTNDVTAGYIVSDVERLRAPMQKITDYILKCMGAIKSADVVPIHQSIAV